MSDPGFIGPDSASPTAFYFSVTFPGMENMDSSFQEVTGLKMTFDIAKKKEGGENDSVHHLPAQPKFDKLVLKRCLVSNSKLENWCRDAIDNLIFDPKDIHISLRSANASDVNILASWKIIRAFPISWELSSLNSNSNVLAIETLALNYRLFKRELL